jgi:TM2 domain-containing membrane protein YozV/DNA-directed RNA polymerase subunit RPC12/RpoP
MARSNYCENCNAAIADEGYPCPECGHDPPKYKSPWLAAVLSFLITGLGHLYVGRAGRGVAWFLGAGLIGGTISLTTQGLIVLAWLLVPVAAATDAFLVAPTARRANTTADAADRVNEYECFNCGTEFTSVKTKTDASCPECGGIPKPE